MNDTREKLENMPLSNGHARPCPPPAGIPRGPRHGMCAEIDMRIDVDARWFYQGTPIQRQGLVDLFASVLRRDADGHYWLITPVEMARIRVDDAPFLAVDMRETSDNGVTLIEMRLNTGTWVPVDARHPIEVRTDPESGAPRPYLTVADDGTEARIDRSTFYTLVAHARETDMEGTTVLTVTSAGTTFVLGPAGDET